MIQRQTYTVYKIDTEANGLIMPFKIFKSLFSKSTLKAATYHKKNAMVLKTYNNSNIEKMGNCTVKLQHKIML